MTLLCQVRDVAALARLSCLLTLNLDGTEVSESGLEHLASHPLLSSLSLAGISVADGNQALQIISGVPPALLLSFSSVDEMTDQKKPVLALLRPEFDSADAPWTPLCDRQRFVVSVSADSAHRAGPDRLHAGHRPGGGPARLHEKVVLVFSSVNCASCAGGDSSVVPAG